jgi:predicted aspartyl protease
MRCLLLLSFAACILPVSAAYSGQIASPQTAPVAHVSSRERLPLDQLVAEHDWPVLERVLNSNTGPQTAYYRGLLLNRTGQYEQSLQLLEPLIPELASGIDRVHEKLARLALAAVYFRMFRYRQAAEEYAALDKCCAASLSEDERDEVELPSKILPLLESAAAQTLELSESFSVPLRGNALGVHEIEVWVDGHPSRWLFDPAANFTLLSRSQAKRIGLKLAGGDGLTVRSLTGEPVRVQAAVIPQLKFGAAFFRNVPTAIFEDADLFDKAHQYQIEGVLAQPLLAALGAVTVSDDGHLNILRQAPLKGGAPLFSDGQRLLVSVDVKDAQQLYEIDPRRARSGLSPRYFPALTAESLTLDFGGTAATFHEIPALTPTDGARFYGTLGGDALDQLASYTFDFRSMRFLVREHGEQ